MRDMRDYFAADRQPPVHIFDSFIPTTCRRAQRAGKRGRDDAPARARSDRSSRPPRYAIFADFHRFSMPPLCYSDTQTTMRPL